MDKREEVLAHFEEGRRMHLKQQKQVKDNARILRLMEAGLKEWPLDRDFFERIESEFNQDIVKEKEMGGMLAALKDVIEHIERQSD